MFLTFLVYFVLFVLISAAIIYIDFWRKYKFWENLGVPYLKPTFPFGNIPESITGRLHFAHILKRKYEKIKHEGDYCGLFFFRQPVLCILTPEMCKNVLVKDFDYFMDRGLYFHEEVDPLSANLFFIEGEKWRTLRAKLTPTFTSGKLKSMFNTILDVGNELINHLMERIGKENEIDIRDVLVRFIMDVIGSCAFGLDINCLQNPTTEFYDKGKRTMNFPLNKSLKLFISTLFRNQARKFKVRFNDKDIEEFYFRVVKDVIDYRRKHKVSRNDFMQLLLEMHESSNENNHLTLEEITAQAFVFFFAGFETSSTTLTYAIHLLSYHQDIQNKCKEEISSVLKTSNNSFSYDSIIKMQYLEQVINETLRMYPPVASIHRIVTKEYLIPGTNITLPKGLAVVIPNHAIQNDANIFPEPDKFDPDRFSKENCNSRHSFSHMPFGEGPRVCVGKRFGQLQTRLTLAMLLSKFRFEPCSRTDIPIKIHPVNLIYAPLGEVWLKVKSRS